LTFCPTEFDMHASANLRLLAFATLLAGAVNANAALTVYTDRASFLAALSAPGVDSFDDLPLDADIGDPLDRTAGAYAYSAASFGAAAGLVALGTTPGAWLSTRSSFADLMLSGISPGVRAIGGYFFATDESGAPTTDQAVTVSASAAGKSASDPGESAMQVVLKPSTTSFVGFVSTGQFTSLQASAGNNDNYFVTANDITMGTVTAVPEPETSALFLAGAGLLVVARRRGSIGT
jgi:PEP-CTERM motif